MLPAQLSAQEPNSTGTVLVNIFHLMTSPSQIWLLLKNRKLTELQMKQWEWEKIYASTSTVKEAQSVGKGITFNNSMHRSSTVDHVSDFVCQTCNNVYLNEKCIAAIFSGETFILCTKHYQITHKSQQEYYGSDFDCCHPTNKLLGTHTHALKLAIGWQIINMCHLLLVTTSLWRIFTPTL